MDLLERRRELMSLTFVPHDYSQDYLTFKIKTSGTVGMKLGSSANSVTVQYKLNSGNWTSLTPTTSGVTFNVSAGDVVLWKNTVARYSKGTSQNNATWFTGTAEFDVCGNIMSLIKGDSFTSTHTFSSSNQYMFMYLFNVANVISAKNLILYVTNLSGTTQQYGRMFNGCSSLTTPPSLPATTLSNQCYREMFYGCTSLTYVPALPAMEVTQYCYYQMFRGCTALTSAVELPATTIKSNCYESMFYGCTSLKYAPTELPATTLDGNCYSYMFYGCTSLETVPKLPATTLKSYCYNYMFYNCKAITTAPDLLAPTLTNYCYYNMFYGCSNLSYIKCTATSISASNAVNSWVRNVKASGTFVKDASTTWPTGYSGIPSGWTVQNA